MDNPLETKHSKKSTEQKKTGWIDATAAKKTNEAAEKSEGESKRVKKIMDKYKGMKNKFNPKPSIESKGTSTVSSHIAGDENVNS